MATITVDPGAETDLAVAFALAEAIAVVSRSQALLRHAESDEERKAVSSHIALMVLRKALGRFDDDPSRPKRVKELLDAIEDMHSAAEGRHGG